MIEWRLSIGNRFTGLVVCPIPNGRACGASTTAAGSPTWSIWSGPKTRPSVGFGRKDRVGPKVSVGSAARRLWRGPPSRQTSRPLPRPPTGHIGSRRDDEQLLSPLVAEFRGDRTSEGGRPTVWLAALAVHGLALATEGYL